MLTSDTTRGLNMLSGVASYICSSAPDVVVISISEYFSLFMLLMFEFIVGRNDNFPSSIFPPIINVEVVFP